ncbi:MAG: hypothetical protein ACLU4N_13875 [Butyricimonas faecihominis]
MMAYVFPLLFIWVAGTLLTVLLLLFVELFELYKRVDGIDASRVVADKLSNGEENPVGLVLRNRYPVSTCLRVIDEIPVEFQNRNVLFRLKVNAGEQGRSITRYVLQNEVLIISEDSGIRVRAFWVGRKALFFSCGSGCGCLSLVYDDAPLRVDGLRELPSGEWRHPYPGSRGKHGLRTD